MNKIILLIFSAMISVAGHATEIENYCDSLKGDLMVACYYGAAKGIIRCDDYPTHLMLACHKGSINPDNGNAYDMSMEPVCDSLKGDLIVACYNGAKDIVTCDDYPGDLMIACYNGMLNPDNGRFYKLKN